MARRLDGAVSIDRAPLLVKQADPRGLAESIVRALKSKDLREQAAGLNAKRIAEGAEYKACMLQASAFYKRVVSGS